MTAETAEAIRQKIESRLAGRDKERLAAQIALLAELIADLQAKRELMIGQLQQLNEKYPAITAG